MLVKVACFAEPRGEETHAACLVAARSIWSRWLTAGSAPTTAISGFWALTALPTSCARDVRSRALGAHDVRGRATVDGATRRMHLIVFA